jgi:prevent-host-death family protein
MLSEQIGAFEAKTHLSKILDKVEGGADFTITRRGKPVAKIIPFRKEPEMTRIEALDKLFEMRKLYRGEPGSFDIRAAIEEGRR